MENQVCLWLKNTHHVTVSVEWVNACIEWLQQEQPTPAKELPTAVYNQWLLSNLHDLEFKCLPDRLSLSSEATLNGSYALQIDSVVDISKPMYQQLIHLKGRDYSNAEVTAKTEKKEEISKHRLLKLKLTDGVQNINAHEYRPIPCLNVNLSPGTKVLVFGSVKCHNGTLMLTKDNVKLLGGEASELAETNSQLAIIQSKLNITNAAGEDVNPSVQTNTVPSLPAIPRLQEPEFEIPQRSYSTPSNKRSASIKQPLQKSRTYSGHTTTNQKPNTNLNNDNLGPDDDEEFFNVDIPSVASTSANDSASRPSFDADDFIDDDEEFEKFLHSTCTKASKRAKINQPPPPFTYLNSLPKLPTDKNIEMTIKAFIVSFVGGLRTNNGTAWSFKVLLNDGTATIPAEFADDILARIIGMPAFTFNQLKVSSSNDVKSKERIIGILENAKRKLQDLSCLFDIEIKLNSSTASILNVREITNDVYQYLKNNN